MKKSSLFLLMPMFLLVALSSTSFGRDNRNFSNKDFTAIEIGSGMHLNVTQSDSYSIEAVGDKDDLNDLDVEQSGDVLKIRFKSSFFGFGRHHRVDFNIQMPQLTRLDLSGGAKGNIKMDVASKKFSTGLSGGSQLEGNLKCGNISMELSGGSRAGLNGAGSNLKIEGSGGSKFRLKDFSSVDVDVELSGGSQATINMNGTLDADLSGGSHIYYYGKIELGSTDFSGGSGISKGR